ncbi:MAG: cupin domain-containing protein [Ignavibacteriaceae bacterium]
MTFVKNIYDELGWKHAEGYPPGTKIKTLPIKVSAKIVLMKLPAGFQMDSHAHIYDEQHIVLEGEYESDGVVYSSGAYRLIHAHKNHGPFTSKEGAIILVCWDYIE